MATLLLNCSETSVSLRTTRHYTLQDGDFVFTLLRNVRMSSGGTWTNKKGLLPLVYGNCCRRGFTSIGLKVARQRRRGQTHGQTAVHRQKIDLTSAARSSDSQLQVTLIIFATNGLQAAEVLLGVAADLGLRSDTQFRHATTSRSSDGVHKSPPQDPSLNRHRHSEPPRPISLRHILLSSNSPTSRKIPFLTTHILQDFFLLTLLLAIRIT
jgi:hypothetical protein